MSKAIEQLMTRDVKCISADATIQEAARMMRHFDIGDVVVVQSDGAMCGIVTDRDLVVRGLAQGHDISQCKVSDVCTREVATLTPDAAVGEAIALMTDRAVRRVPVVDREGQPIGIVSIGDLAQAQDPESALGEISSAPPQH